MKAVRISQAAEAALTDILAYSIEKWGSDQAERYRDQLRDRERAVARGELPHPRPCEALLLSRRDAAGLCYCHAGRYFIILRESATHIEVVEFIHQNRDLDRLIGMLI